MAGYNVVKTQKALPIGSVQPWGGNVSDIPSGWLLCNGQELQGSEYPLLARILRDTYGGEWNNDDVFPNYTGTFRLPPTNDKALADISDEYFGISEFASYPNWAANTQYGAGDVVVYDGTKYSVSLNDDTATSFSSGTTPPTSNGFTTPDGKITYTELSVSSLVPNVIDNPEALSVVGEYIGSSSPGFEPGDLGPPNTQNAITDILMTYTPDPEGTAQGIAFTGTPPSVAEPISIDIAEGTVQNLTNISNGAAVTGTGVTFQVILDEDGSGGTSLNVIRKAKGQGYKPQDQVKIPGTALVDASGTSANDIVITILSVGSSLFDGTITGHQLLPGFGIKEVYIAARKLGRYHVPTHYHPGVYETVNWNDNNARPGKGPTIYSNPTFEAREFLEAENPCWEAFFGIFGGCAPETTLECSEPTHFFIGDTNNPSDALKNVIGGQSNGRYACGYLVGGMPIKNNIPFRTNAGSHGIAVQSFVGTGSTQNLKSGTTNTEGSPTAALPYTGSFAERLQQVRVDGYFYPGHLIPESDETSPIEQPNYQGSYSPDPLSANYGPTDTLFDTAGVDFNIEANETLGKTIIEAHDHDGEISIQYNGDDMSVLETLQVKAAAYVNPAPINDALMMTFTTRVPSLTIANLIRAY